MQPFFAWLCVAVNILFVFIKGPKMLRVKPIWKAVVVSSAIGTAVVLLVYPIVEMVRRRKKSTVPSAGSKNVDTKGPSITPTEPVIGNSKIDLEMTSASEEDPATTKATLPQDAAMPVQRRSWRMRGLEKLGLNEDITASESKRHFSFRTYESVPDKPVDENEFQEAEAYFVKLLIVSAFSVSVAHGGNDVGNAVGPMSAILEIYNTGTVAKTPDIPLWATLYGSLGFAVGILTMGRFTIKTVGTKITVLSPSKAFATQIGGAVAVLSASVLGMPVSTSHCLVGAVFGIGIVQKLMGTGTLNMKVLTRIFVVWIVTIPLAMLMVITVFYPFSHFF